MLCLGVFLMSFTILPLGVDDEHFDQSINDAACMSIPWFLSIGFTTAFAALFSKTWRINKIYHNPAPLLRHRGGSGSSSGSGSVLYSRIEIGAKDVLGPYVVLMMINIVVLVCWTILNPLRFHRFDYEGTDDWNRKISSYGICVSGTSQKTDDDHRHQKSPYYVSILALVNFGVLLLSNIQAYQARSIQSEFNESQYISIIMASMLQAFVIGIPIMALVGGKLPRVFYLVGISLIFVVCMVILLLLFLPKMLFLSRERQQEKKDGSSKNNNNNNNNNYNNNNRNPKKRKLPQLLHYKNDDYSSNNYDSIILPSSSLPSIPENQQQQQQQQTSSSIPFSCTTDYHGNNSGGGGSWLSPPSIATATDAVRSILSNDRDESFDGTITSRSSSNPSRIKICNYGGGGGGAATTTAVSRRGILEVSDLGASSEVSITFHDNEDEELYEEDIEHYSGGSNKSNDVDLPPVRPTRLESDNILDVDVDRNESSRRGTTSVTSRTDDDEEQQEKGGGRAAVAGYSSVKDDNENENHGINVVKSIIGNNDNNTNNKMVKIRPWSFCSTNYTTTKTTSSGSGSGTVVEPLSTTSAEGVVVFPVIPDPPPPPPNGCDGGTTNNDFSPTRPIRVDSEKDE